jgi:hypothetical protein
MAPSLRGGAGRARATGDEHIDKRLKDSNHPLRKSIVFVLPEVGVRFLIRTLQWLLPALGGGAHRPAREWHAQTICLLSATPPLPRRAPNGPNGLAASSSKEDSESAFHQGQSRSSPRLRSKIDVERSGKRTRCRWPPVPPPPLIGTQNIWKAVQ